MLPLKSQINKDLITGKRGVSLYITQPTPIKRIL